MTDTARTRRLALDLLTRREHSRRQLREKLVRKGCDPTVAPRIVDQLAAENLQSDERFVENLVRVRRERGYGPLRIQKELEENDIAPELIDSAVDFTNREWLALLRRVQRKKFGDRRPRNYAERARQARFLQSRGFTADQIMRILKPQAEE